ncbi:metal-dependent hydrolase [Xylophilus sp. ASV27]|uniref:metal-dependent hydrolase n=1 Tax=Xylophilus sp. ASV27 TaxID=2795129 RepID=UPI0018EC4329|nr:metal-dependent hydrolase [Xylophilus sp. ASV27]
MRPATPPPERLIVRKLEIDLKRGFARHWHGGRAYRTQFFNALSMSFPVGEQFFIDAVRDAARALPAGPQHDAMRETVAGFIGQEATHRRIHGLYNEELERQGLVNRWQHWATARIARFRRLVSDPRHALAVTCAYEHFTALLADGTLRHTRWLDGADADMQTVWRWHAAEETEHCAVAYDLYQALGGSYRWRVRWYLYVCLVFGIDATRQTLINLWRDGTLLRPSTWADGLRLFWGRDGLVWRCAGPMLAYFRRDFHPSQDTHAVPAQTLAARWLAAHAALLRPVR